MHAEYALAITNDKNIVDVHFILYGMINIWKEPMQACLPELMKGYTVGMEIQVR